jgi:hypothetical protein
MGTHDLWYEQEGDQLASCVQADVNWMRGRCETERVKDEIHEVIYGNCPIGRNGPLTILASGSGSPIRLNVTRSMVDTIVSRIGVNVPMVKVAADNAKWSHKLRARRLSRFLAAKMGELAFRRRAPEVFRDACVVGTGVCKVTSEHGELCIELVPKHEVYVDPVAARYGTPQDLHHRKQYSREQLGALYPDHADAIAMLPQARPRDDYDQDIGRSNLADVTESWHLPSAPGADDGVHAVTAGGVVLFREPWTRRRFPFAFLHWSEPRGIQGGFWGTGLCEELAPLQWSIDQTISVLDRGFKLGAPLKVLLPRQSKIVKSHITNEVGAIIEYSGAVPPQFHAPSNPVAQQQINWLMTLFDWAFQIAGISQLAAGSKKPAGLESAVAMQTYHDFETLRFARVEAAYEAFHVDVATLMIDEARAITEAGNNYSAKWVNRDTLHKIRWSDVDLDADTFTLKLAPVNMLIGTHAGKLERATQLAQSGLVPQHWLLPLMDSPDIERFLRLETAQFNFLEWTVEELMTDDAELPPVDSHMDLDLGIKHVGAAYLDNFTDRAPERVLNRFREWLELAVNKQQKAQAAAAPPAPGAGGPGLPAGPAPETLPGESLPGAPVAA